MKKFKCTFVWLLSIISPAVKVEIEIIVYTIVDGITASIFVIIKFKRTRDPKVTYLLQISKLFSFKELSNYVIRMCRAHERIPIMIIINHDIIFRFI